MIRSSRLLPILLCAGLALSPLHAATDAEVDAHRNVLDLAGAFTNDGFKLRDGIYTSTLQGKGKALVQVNLYAGNEYWFSAATNDPSTKITIAVYDETGQPVKTDPYADANRVAAGFAPDISGPYYVQIQDASGASAPPETFCLIYSYK